MKFGKSYIYTNKLTLLGKLGFYIYGFPFIGSYLRSLYFCQVIKGLKNKPFADILDAGCGAGEYSLYLAETFPKALVEGCDVDLDNNLESISEKFEINNLKFYQKDLHSLEDKKKWDLINCIDVLEHIASNKIILEKFYQALKEDGYLIVHIPQKDWHEINFINKKYFIKHNEFTEEEHCGAHYDLEDFKGIIKSIGFQIIQLKYTFGRFGKLAWEIDQFIKFKKYNKFMPFSIIFCKLLCWLDILIKNKKGCGIFLLAKKSQ